MSNAKTDSAKKTEKQGELYDLLKTSRAWVNNVDDGSEQYKKEYARMYSTDPYAKHVAIEVMVCADLKDQGDSTELVYDVDAASAFANRLSDAFNIPSRYFPSTYLKKSTSSSDFAGYFDPGRHFIVGKSTLFVEHDRIRLYGFTFESFRECLTGSERPDCTTRTMQESLPVRGQSEGYSTALHVKLSIYR